MRLILAFLIAISPACCAWGATEHYEVNSVEVAAAISSLGVQVQSGDVTLLAHAVAAIPFPKLRIGASKQSYNNSLLLRVECVEPQDCLPFFVSIHGDQRSIARLEAITETEPSSSFSQVNKPASQAAIRTGEPVLLLLEGPHIHIRIPVVSLENGAVGQRIRVKEEGNHQSYTGVIVKDGVVQGRL